MTIQERLSERSEWVISKYQDGWSTVDIAKEFNCNPGTVWHWMKNNGVEIRKRSDVYGQSERYEPELRRLHAEGLSAYAIGKQIGIEKHTVLRWLEKIGLSTSHLSSAREDPLVDHKDEIIAKYNSGQSTCSLAEEYQTSSSSIWQLLQNNDVECRDRAKYSFNEEFFDDINTEAKAYILGFWYADGNNMKGGVGVRLQITDLDILERIKQEMGYTGPLLCRSRENDGNRKPIYTLQLNGRKLSESLTRLGCPENKTFLLRFPTSDIVPDHLIHHFARGYFDGDGNIGKYGSWRIQLVGTRHMMEGFSSASGVPGYFTQRHPEREKDNWTWVAYRKHEFPVVAAWLYRDATIYLPRKHAKYQEFLASLNPSTLASPATPPERSSGVLAV